MSTRLPAIVPFNDSVIVCVECCRAACAQHRYRCDAAKRGPVGLAPLLLATVQLAAMESPSYWKVKPAGHNDDLPLDVEDLGHLVRWTREQARIERQELDTYLLYELGIDPDQVAEAMAKEWPEAEGAS